jgi:hypothetical protein
MTIMGCLHSTQISPMALQGFGLEATDDQRPVPCCVQVTLNSAQRRWLRQAGPLVIEGPVSLATWKLCRRQFPLSTGERRESWI